MSAANEQVMSTGKSLGATKAETAVRLLLGAFLAFSVLDAIFHLAPQPEMPAAAMSFFGALGATGYFLPLLKATEFLVAVALLSNHFVALALVVLAPITINVALFHAVLAPGGIAAGIILMALHLTLAWFKRDSYRDLLRSK